MNDCYLCHKALCLGLSSHQRTWKTGFEDWVFLAGAQKRIRGVSSQMGWVKEDTELFSPGRAYVDPL